MADGQRADGGRAGEALLERARDWLDAGNGAAVATVVETWGSAPRQPGARLVISSKAELEGSVSGGCVEGAVVAEALEAIGDGTPRLLTYGVSDDDAFAVGLACGGTIRVLVDPIASGDAPGMPRAHLERLIAARREREAIGYEIALETWARAFRTPSDAPEAFAADKSGVSEDGARFLALDNPPLRLAIVGAAHIAQALAPMAAIAGYDVAVVDPRGAFATEARFPGLKEGETLLTDWPDAALEAHGLDARTAVVCLTHDPKIDDPALRRALASDAFYVGALGSTRTHAKRVDRLAEAGLSEAEISRLDAPIGLDIGAKSPAEIAIAIMGAMTLALRRPEMRG